MVVYNITVRVEPQIAEEWLRWQKEEHIPDILATGHFTENHLFRLLHEEDNGGITYVSQFFSASQEDLQAYLEKEAPVMRKKAVEKWGDRFVAFRTIMERV